ncbi:hypothetical protein BTM25_11490 [Actinomadura rubteroloni]|uniref:YbaB/EbfC family DNA-binding protein n=1 Tax=Actinomadura rubteroloni TaxID=1926885 RepID=A0A2P4UNX7_9ACTN|nr:YbaB/EbfC family nucleoid-associated protein [Actinomadura rubteroloni]POM26743.1 hypothetical protein BTM25_11490 [Actinomadura rubteroloni]
MDDENSRMAPEERLREARERLAALRDGSGRSASGDPGPAGRASGTADDERVTATAARGRLVGLELDPRTLRQSPETLGRHIAEAANAALTALRVQAQEAGTDPVIDPATLVRTVQAVQEQGLREMTALTESIGEAVARARAGMR